MATQISNKRRRPSENEMIVLLSEVDRQCPLCLKPLQYQKNGRLHRSVEIAHIYPLNPTAKEAALLANEVRLSTDVNAIENLLAICGGCHTEFDKPRTVEDYRRVVAIKRSLLERSASREKRSKFPLQEELRVIVEALLKADVTGEAGNIPLTYNPKTLHEKVGDKLDHLTKSRVQFEITSYYQCAKEAFRSLEIANTISAQQILHQVRLYYLEQVNLSLSHADILCEIAGWVAARTGASVEASNILASFFVQNCEVF